MLHVSREPEPVTTRALLEGAWRARGALVRAGVRPGDRVPILLPTSAHFIWAFFGAMLAGAAPVPLAAPLTFGSLDRYLRRLAAVISDSGAKVLVTTARIRDALANDPAAVEGLDSVLLPEDLDVKGPADPRVPSVDASSRALLQYTSGTTGHPKGVVISHGALVSNAHAIATALELSDRDVGASWLPMFHDMGLIGVVVTAAYRPYPVHLLRPESFIMRPSRWLALVASQRATISAAPNFAYEMATKRVDPSALDGLGSWRAALNGAEPVRPRTIERFAERFAPAGYDSTAMMPVYGMAEATLAVTFPSLGHKLRVEQVDPERLQRAAFAAPSAAGNARTTISCGAPVNRTSLRVRGGARVLDEGQVGEIEVQGPSLMDGYFRNEEASAAALVDGWLRTGDLGYVRGGQLFVVGRAKDVIIKGGRNLYPEDIERIASEAPGADAGVAAVGRPCAETGTEELVVLVETRAKDPAEREETARVVRGELLAAIEAKVDDVVLCPVGSLPRTTSGKVQRGACALLVAGGSWP